MGLTAIPWQLPYPDATESPDYGAFQLYSLADRMDYHLTNWRDDDTRLKRRPAAKLAYQSTVRYKINSRALSVVYYNNVLCDTAQMTDLQKRADRIYLPYTNRPGLYAVGGSITGLAATNPTVPDIRLNSNAVWYNNAGYANFTTRDLNQDRGDTGYGETFSVSSTVLAYQNTMGQYNGEIWIQLEINSGIDFNVWSADLWAFWLTDCGTINAT